jgi:predicted anti-sigma-YlaC factor YlaD
MLGSRDELVCREVVEMVTDYLEGTLTRAQRRRLEEHLAACDGCSEYLEQMRTTIRLTGELAGEDFTPRIRDELSALYRRWRSEENGPAAEHPRRE